MKTISVSELKTNFAKVLKDRETVAVTFGKQKKIIGHFTPVVGEPKKKRQLGILEGIATITFMDDFKITEEEFLGLK